MGSGKRPARVGELIFREIAYLLMDTLKDPRVRGVTLTGLRLSDDVRQAKVFFSVMGDKEEIEAAQAGLNSAKGFIKREIGKRIRIRYVPELQFFYDATLREGHRMERLLKDIQPSVPEEGGEG